MNLQQPNYTQQQSSQRQNLAKTKSGTKKKYTQSRYYTKTQVYQSDSIKKMFPLPYYFQQHEITKNQLTNFTQIPNTADSLQITMNP